MECSNGFFAKRDRNGSLQGNARCGNGGCYRESLSLFCLELPVEILNTEVADYIKPSALGILGSSFPPSQTKSTAFATFSAGAPIGGCLGAVLGGL